MLILTTGVVAENYKSPEDTTSIRTIFGTGSEDVSESFRSITTPTQTPLVADLDNDGTNEIVVVDGDNVEIYQGITLSVITGQNAEDNIHHAVLHDIDNDNTTEIISVGGDKVTIFDFNGTTLTLTSNWTIPNIESSEFMIGCDGNNCIIVNAQQKDGVPSAEEIYAHAFNSTGIYNTTLLETAVDNEDWSLPPIREVVISDYNKDGTNNFIFTACEGFTCTTCDINIFALSLTGSKINIDLELDTGHDVYDNGFTSPAVHDFAPNVNGDKQEIIIGYQTSASEYLILMYDSDGNKEDEYPEAIFDNPNGRIISNVIKTNIFADTGEQDFCVMGYDTTNDEIFLTCGSEVTGQTFEHKTYSYDGTNYYDLTEPTYTGNTPSNRIANAKIQSINALQTDVDGTNVNEFITPYGVFRADWNWWTGSTLYQIYDITESDGSAVMVDAQDSGRADILYLNSDGIYYIDDGFLNSQVDFDTNPKINTGNPVCLDQTIKVTLDVSDSDGDLIYCWVEEQYINESVKDTLANQTSTGANLNFYYVADEEGNFLIEMYCTDNQTGHTPIQSTYDVFVKNRSTGNTSKGCYDWGENPQEVDYISTENEASNDQFDENIDELLDGFGATSPKIRNILGLIMAVFIGGIIFSVTRLTIGAIGGFALGLVIAWLFGLLSSFVVTSMVIIAVVMLLYMLFRY